ncbi:MAG: hypothetical protein SFT91_05735 [Rickettsiaceae bacterium]|nr:hypothetical protein [Rickettsiaceae bacterium]
MRLIFLVLFLLSSCHGISSEVSKELSSIEVNFENHTPDEYEFSTHLSRLLNTDHSRPKRYKLKIDFAKSNSVLAIQKDTDSVRNTLEFNVYYKLYEINPESYIISQSKPILSGRFRNVSSYNTLFSPYSTEVEMNKNSSDLYLASAEELKRRLLIFFGKKF